MSYEDLEKDQQEILEKSDINTLANYCQELRTYEDEIEELEQQIKSKIPNLLAEQGLASLKLADGRTVDVRKTYNCTIRKDNMESAYKWLRDNGLADIIKNEVSVQFGKGEDDKAKQLLDLAVTNGYEPQQKTKVEPMTLKALYRERVEAGLDMPSESFSLFVKDQTKISRK